MRKFGFVVYVFDILPLAIDRFVVVLCYIICYIIEVYWKIHANFLKRLCDIAEEEEEEASLSLMPCLDEKWSSF